MSEHADFLFQSVVKEEQSGWCSQFMSEEEVDQLFPRGWAPIPSFCHEQASGKLRRIDNANASDATEAVATSEQATMHSAFQPGLVARAVYRQLQVLGVHPRSLADSLETGGEDVPDAYRGLPVSAEDLCCNIVISALMLSLAVCRCMCSSLNMSSF